MEQQIRFCTTPDDVQIAYARHGTGPPLVKAGTWFTHLQHDWQSPVWRHWLDGLAQTHTLVRYDDRGCGLSDREVDDWSLERWLGDLETVVDHAGIDRFALLGLSQGGPLAIAYAVRHPERVTRLILFGAYAVGAFARATSQRKLEQLDVVVSLMRIGWGRADPVFRRVFTTAFVPGGTPEQMEWFDEVQRLSTSPENAVRIFRRLGEIDVIGLARQVTTPTLVLHARDDAAVPFAQGRLLATLIPGARFVPLAGRNHILLADEPGWRIFLQEVRDFLGTHTPAQPAASAELSSRELQVLELVAAGMSNEDIAARLFVSVRTVERHLSNVYAKLRVSGKSARAAAAAHYVEAASARTQVAW
jgi:pimeloyl-ACP methyl ester carboxylesterase/DNA-binding CsgD family transcriptional regulator